MTNHCIKPTQLYHHSNERNTSIALLFWILVLAGETFRWLPIDLTLEFWTILPPILFPLWFRYWDKWDSFLWCKTFSLIPLAVITCTLLRMGMDERWTRLLSFAVLSLNIAEAVAKDLVSENRLNAFAGILLIATVIPTMRTIHIQQDPPGDFLWSLGPSWIIAYTVWNWVFIYGNYAYSVGRHTAVLFAPLLLALRDGWDTWLEARGHTMAFYFMIRCSAYEQLCAMTNVDIHRSKQDLKWMQFASLACVVILLGTLQRTDDQQQGDVIAYEEPQCWQDSFPGLPCHVTKPILL